MVTLRNQGYALLTMNEIAYCCGNTFPMQNMIFKRTFKLQLDVQTIVVYEIEELKYKKRLFERITQIERKEGEACCARFAKSVVICKAFYFTLYPDQNNKDHTFIMYVFKSYRAYVSPQKQMMPPPRIPGHIGYYRHDLPGRADRPLLN